MGGVKSCDSIGNAQQIATGSLALDGTIEAGEPTNAQLDTGDLVSNIAAALEEKMGEAQRAHDVEKQLEEVSADIEKVSQRMMAQGNIRRAQIFARRKGDELRQIFERWEPKVETDEKPDFVFANIDGQNVPVMEISSKKASPKPTNWDYDGYRHADIYNNDDVIQLAQSINVELGSLLNSIGILSDRASLVYKIFVDPSGAMFEQKVIIDSYGGMSRVFLRPSEVRRRRKAASTSAQGHLESRYGSLEPDVEDVDGEANGPDRVNGLEPIKFDKKSPDLVAEVAKLGHDSLVEDMQEMYKLFAKAQAQFSPDDHSAEALESIKEQIPLPRRNIFFNRAENEAQIAAAEQRRTDALNEWRTEQSRLMLVEGDKMAADYLASHPYLQMSPSEVRAICAKVDSISDLSSIVLSDFRVFGATPELDAEMNELEKRKGMLESDLW